MRGFFEGFFGVIGIAIILAIITIVMIFLIILFTPYLTEGGSILIVSTLLVAILAGIMNIN